MSRPGVVEAAVTPDTDGVANVISALSSLSPAALLSLVVIVTVLVLYRVYVNRISFNQRKLEMEQSREDNLRLSTSLEKLSKDIRAHTKSEADTSSRLQASLTELLAVSSGYLSWEDSLRVVEDTFKSKILKDFQRIAESSIYRNSYVKNKEDIRLRVCRAFDMNINQAINSLNRYSLSLSISTLFPRNAAGTAYRLTERSWGLLEEAHEANVRTRAEYALRQKVGEANISDTATDRHATSVYIKLEKLFDQEFKEFESSVMDVFPQDHTRFIRAVPTPQAE